MSTINDRTTVPLPWLIAGLVATVTFVGGAAVAYANIINRLDALQNEQTAQWTSIHMELWVEKAKQRTQLKDLPSASEVKR